MKWFAASDIHGSAFYCRKMIEAYRKEKADRILFLGDLLYHGPRNDLPREYDPKAVTAMLNGLAREIVCVRGNCEAEVDQMVLDFPVMADYCIIDLGKHMMYASHGHKFQGFQGLPLHPGDIYIQGHTHIPMFAEEDGIYHMNPGSVSIPKEGSAHGYMIIEGNRFTWKNLDGQVLQEQILSL